MSAKERALGKVGSNERVKLHNLFVLVNALFDKRTFNDKQTAELNQVCA